MTKKMNLVGNTYGDLTAITYLHKTESNGRPHYLCQCSCGKQKVISHSHLRSGNTTSCGCKQYKSGTENPNYLHGFPKNHKTYKSWCKIKERCYNPNDTSYLEYGAKGIKMSETFKDNFLAFYAEVGEPPKNSPDWSVDRIDNNLGYIEGNLRWADRYHQARNRGIMKNNTSGETGVSFYQHMGCKSTPTYTVAKWKDISGKDFNKKFSVRKLGLLPAFAAAVEYRRQMIAELNEQGAGYTENHGNMENKKGNT